MQPSLHILILARESEIIGNRGRTIYSSLPKRIILSTPNHSPTNGGQLLRSPQVVVLVPKIFRSHLHKERISCLILYYKRPPKGFFFTPGTCVPYVKELPKAYSKPDPISSKGLQLKRKWHHLFFLLTAKLKSDRIPSSALCRARRVRRKKEWTEYLNPVGWRH